MIKKLTPFNAWIKPMSQDYDELQLLQISQRLGQLQCCRFRNQETKLYMEEKPTFAIAAESSISHSHSEPNLSEEREDLGSVLATDIILNNDFSQGLHLWHPNCCDAFVAPPMPPHPASQSPMLGGRFAVITNRTECWQGLEQNITDRVSAGSTYRVSAWVAISGAVQGDANVQATLKLEQQDSSISYLFIGRTSALTERWEKVEGTFELSIVPHRVIFYLEGPSPGIDLLIRSVEVSYTSIAHSHTNTNEGLNDLGNNRHASNIVLNHDFSEGLHSWGPNCCDAFLAPPVPHHPESQSPKLGGGFVVVTNRRKSWQGLEKDITDRISAGSTYSFCATVAISGLVQGDADVQVTLRLEQKNSSASDLVIGRTAASTERWEKVEGTFELSILPVRVVLFLKGPSPGIDLLIRSVQVSCI